MSRFTTTQESNSHGDPLIANVEYDPEAVKSASDNLADLPIGLSDIKRQPIEWDKMKPVMKSILNNNNSTVQTVQVNLCQKHLFSHQLTQNMRKDCSLIYKFST